MAAQVVVMLRFVRQAHGWTQFDVSAKSGIGTGRLSQLERAQVEPTDSEAQSLARVFGIPADVLFKIETPEALAAAGASRDS